MHPRAGKKSVSAKNAKKRILDAAGDVFGEKGYKAATVREICRRAGVNLAAINYYYGGKKELYLEVARELIASTFSRYAVELDDGGRAGPEERLAFFVRGALQRMLSPDGITSGPGKRRLLARELADPSPVLENVVKEYVRPTALVLHRIISDLMGPDAPEEDVIRCQVSVIGQCFHYAVARPIISRIVPLDIAAEGFIDQLARHITRFSLAGIMAAKKAGKESAKD